MLQFVCGLIFWILLKHIVCREVVWENFDDVCYLDNNLRRSPTANKRCENIPNLLVEKRFFKNINQYCIQFESVDTNPNVTMNEQNSHIPVGKIQLGDSVHQEISITIPRNSFDPGNNLFLNGTITSTSYRSTKVELTLRTLFMDYNPISIVYKDNISFSCDLILTSMLENHNATHQLSELNIVFETKKNTNFIHMLSLAYVINKHKTCIVPVTIKTMENGQSAKMLIYRGPNWYELNFPNPHNYVNSLLSVKINDSEACDPLLVNVADQIFDNQRNKNALKYFEKCWELNSVRAEPEPFFCENLPEVNVRLLYLNQMVKFWCVTIDKKFALDTDQYNSKKFQVAIEMTGQNNFVRWYNESNSIVSSSKSNYVFEIQQRIVISIEPKDDINLADDIKSIKINGLESCGLVLDNAMCGVQKIKHRSFISYGWSTVPGQYPWHVAIYDKRDSNVKLYICGGSIIGKNAVLTAAHCVIRDDGNIKADHLSFEVGRFDLRYLAKFTVEYEVIKVITHEAYDSVYFEHDIAILRSKNYIEFNDFVQPICLTSNGEFFKNKTGFVPGWGSNELGERENILSEASVPIIENSECRASNRNFFQNFLFEGKFCGGYRNGTSVCTGDSGGGLVVKFPTRWYLKGIVSLGLANNGMCDLNQYVLFTDIISYNSWILSKMRFNYQY